MADETDPQDGEPAPPGADAEAPPAPAPEKEELSLARRVVSGSGWVLLTHLVSNVLRLAGNLALTRLLFPEAFGLMAVVNSVIQGLVMFSDVGIGPSIVQNPRGTEQSFLRTAWTIQVVRGILLFTAACVLSWPAASFYGQPELQYLVPVAALTALLAGFNSTRFAIQGRQIALKRIVILDLFCQISGVSAMVVWAYLAPSVWALVAGGLTSATLKLAGSHLFLPGDRRDWFGWDKEAARELIRFGRWIFPSTILTFLALRSDRLILARFMTMAQLGVYNIAFFLATALPTLVGALGGRVLFPYYARLAESSPEELGGTIAILRMKLLAISLAPLAGVIAWGPSIINLLYDERYQGAGRMLQILAAGAAVEIIKGTAQPVVLARGDSFRHMLVMAWSAASLVGAMYVGGSHSGVDGLVYAVALTPALSYPATAWAVHRHGVWQPKIDAGALVATLALAGLLSLIPLPF